MKPEVTTIKGQKSWLFSNGNIEAAVTQKGGHMAPVYFYRDTKSPVQPYYISPWAEEEGKVTPGVLKSLRGDFFCMPFGADNRYKNEKHDVHGEPAGERWKDPKLTAEGGAVEFTVTMTTKARPGRITKKIVLKEGHNAVYSEHLLEGYTGPMTLGHHPCLAVPDEDGGMRISTAPIAGGFTAPRPAEALVAAEGEYFAIAPDRRFKSPEKVPTVWKDPPYTDCSLFPQREGFTDLIGLCAKGALQEGPKGGGKKSSSASGAVKPHWTAAAVPSEGYLWFSVKNPLVLPVTVFWMSNFGRHAFPWNGRNRCIGLEDVCAYLAEGLAPSTKKNPVKELEIPTAVKLSSKQPFSVKYIQGVVKIPKTFDRVKTVRFEKDGLLFLSPSENKVKALLDWGFLGI